jgi:hypothetical protein
MPFHRSKVKPALVAPQNKNIPHFLQGRIAFAHLLTLCKPNAPTVGLQRSDTRKALNHRLNKWQGQ